MGEHPDEGIDHNNGRKIKRSNALFGWSTIYGRAGEHSEPYLTRIWIGRLRLHIFHRGDNDPDCHDHPWDFWTFPLVSYVEEVAYPDRDLSISKPLSFHKWRQVVPAFRLSFRPASHCHRVLGPYSGNIIDPFGYIIPCSASRASEWPSNFEPYYDFPSDKGEKIRKIITLVWRGGESRKWGFLKHRDGKWCWIYWKDYVFGAGKDAPCQ